MHIPIIMAAFGTTTRARQTYQVIENKVRDCFPDHPLHWAFTSRMVKDRIQHAQGLEFKHPHQVLNELGEQGCPWAVVQSLHLTAGHEFDRLVDEVTACPVRTSIGLPLLDSPGDYAAVIKGLDQELSHRDRDEALVLVGHGTDHAIWSAYPCLESMARKELGNRVFVGVVEGRPEAGDVVQAVAQAGFKRVRLVPLMLVDGVHFQEDLAGDDEDSWKSLFEGQGIDVAVESRSLGHMACIIDLFVKHIQAALDIIPPQAEQRDSKADRSKVLTGPSSCC